MGLVLLSEAPTVLMIGAASHRQHTGYFRVHCITRSTRLFIS